ncbi:MAG: ferritin-like domain-containing protein [Deltaproteobacteria bacterium]|nr:ferritin-like domain-containing protein [Deltaproteobacteria bacterium]MBW2695570.1 ferritin-like domain-containing protein [Deltaproteobacteria bacterium]
MPMSERIINYDPIYNTVDRDDFESLVEVDRYADRTDAFDAIISATEEHFWNPLDPRYVDFEAEPFDLAEQTIMPREFCIELQTAVADELDEAQKIRLANQSTRFVLSSILHGEQGALSLSASLTSILRDPGAQEYASNQAREEARHVTGFSRYVAHRWGTPLASGPTLRNLLSEIVRSGAVYKKLIGMQMLIEGLAMGAFATLQRDTQDPTLKRLIRFVMTDEAAHHRFGKIWADRTVPKLNEEEHEFVEKWAAECFQVLLFNLVNSEQKQEIYQEFGLDWQWVRSAVMEAFTDEDRRRDMTQSTNIFRVLIKTLLKAGIITERTKHVYAQWVDMDELDAESDEVAGADVAREATEVLKQINSGRMKMGTRYRVN